MGLSDKLRQFGDKAKDAAAEHKDQISKAVESAAVLADKRTGGKYTDTIQKATQRTGAYVDRLAPDEDAGTPPAGSPSGEAEPEPPAVPPSSGTGPEPGRSDRVPPAEGP